MACETIKGLSGAELQVYSDSNGAITAIDGSWLEQVAPEEGPVYIPDPYNPGCVLQLVDHTDEISRNTIVGDVSNNLINKVIENIKKDIRNGDVTAVEELLSFLPENALMAYLPEENTTETPWIVQISDITYDTDGEDCCLPTELVTNCPAGTSDEQAAEIASDFISDTTDFCHTNFRIKIIKPTD